MPHARDPAHGRHGANRIVIRTGVKVEGPYRPGNLNILVVDDETNIRKTLSYCLAADGHTVIAVSNPSDALDEGRRRSFDLAFVDLKLGDDDGMELVSRLLSDSPWLKVVVITAYASIETAVEAMKRGAIDYLSKPFTPDQVRLITRRVGRIRALETEVLTLKQEMQRLDPVARLHSQNAAMQRVMETARTAAASDAIVLLQGESGTGKSVLARAIHQWSPRNVRPFCVVPCPALPAELLESELFGHAQGAFTGAVKENPGRIALCEGGTLFLDEIGEMSLSTQSKLLRFIQDRAYERLGDPTPRQADVRILAASNVDLKERLEQGRFREDLFYRLHVIDVTIPPLRRRVEDILPMATDFLRHFCQSNHKAIERFSGEAERVLQAHCWPGNIRELRNAIERAVILCKNDTIDAVDLPEHMIAAEPIPTIGDPVSIAVIEELHIRRVLASTASIQEAADVLGIDQVTLWRRRQTYGI